MNVAETILISSGMQWHRNVTLCFLQCQQIWKVNVHSTPASVKYLQPCHSSMTYVSYCSFVTSEGAGKMCARAANAVNTKTYNDYIMKVTLRARLQPAAAPVDCLTIIVIAAAGHQTKTQACQQIAAQKSAHPLYMSTPFTLQIYYTICSIS